MKKIILSLLIFMGGCFTASAQEAEQTKEVFNPHWFVGAQFGAQETLGEIKTKDLFSPNAQIYAGYQFNSLFALRLGVGGWQSKGGIKYKEKSYDYRWYYVAPTLDVMFNLTNAFGGYNANRIVDINLLAGLGLNVAMDNSEANALRKTLNVPPTATTPGVEFMRHYWKDNTLSALGRFGASIDFNVSKRVALGLEANANFLSDHYNSKKAPNCDWYFNMLGGIKVKLGKVSKRVPVKPNCMDRIDTVYVTKEKKVVVRDTVTVDKLAAENMRRDIFFTIANSTVSKAEMPKIEDIAAYMNRWPKSKVTITGYADKGTGSAKGNVVYARNRANIVAKLLIEKFGIAENRIIVDSKGDTVQPYDINDLNRVSICIAE